MGYTKSRHLQPKIKYSSLTSLRPNAIWCADVTLLKIADNKKQYIHFLMDHYSKMILGDSVENSSSPKAIKKLLQEAYLKYKSKDPITFLTDGGVENINTTVQKFLRTTDPELKHLIAQKDIPFSNSKIDAFNKIIKHQFLLPRNLEDRKQLINALAEDVPIYNTIRPQYSLHGNTPAETFSGKPLDISYYKTHFDNQKKIRVTQNLQNRCNQCK